MTFPIKRLLIKSLISITLIAFIYLFVFNFVKQEQCIYSWDFGGRYTDFIRINDLIKNQSFQSIKNEILDTIRKSDYNLLSAVILAPFALISTSRICYLFAVLTVYFIPGYVLFMFLAKIINPSINYIQHLSISVLYLFSTILLSPILRGQSSIDGIILINLVLLIFFKNIYRNLNFYIEKIRYLPLFAMSLCLALLPIFHRWYLFFSIFFLAAFFLFNLFFIFKTTKNKLLNIIRLTISQLILLFSTSAIFLYVSGDLWKRYFLIDYSQIYTAFKEHDNVFLSYNHIFSEMGYVIVFLFTASAYLLIKNKKHLLVIFLLIQNLVVIGSFLHIQDFSLHHHYLIIIPFLLIIAWQITSNKSLRFNSLIIVLVLLNFLNAFVIPKPIGVKTVILSQKFVRPFVDANLETVISIMDNALDLANRNQLKSLYVSSGSDEVNSSMFTNEACYYEAKYLPLCEKIAESSYILERDGFPKKFPQSDYIITLNPEPYPDPAITLIDDFVESHPEHYQLIKTYTLKDGIKVNLYYKNKPVPKNLFNELENRFSITNP